MAAHGATFTAKAMSSRSKVVKHPRFGFLRRWSRECASAPVRLLLSRVERRELEHAVECVGGAFELFCERDAEEYVPQVFENVFAALDLIETLDPRRFRLIERNMPRIYIRRGAGAAYWSLIRTCILDLEQVRSGAIGDIALSIVHEATHARLCNRGIHPWPEWEARIETRCGKEQIAFAQRMQGAGWKMDARIEYYHQRLTRPQHTRENYYLHRLQTLRARNAPPWIIWLAERMP
jgi:hypothetical protein